MSRVGKTLARGPTLIGLLTACLAAAAILAICLLAPTEATMGTAQRIVYVHVSVAWFALMSFLVMAGAGAVYLARRNLAWDHWSQAAAELGWLTCSLTLLTGSLWAREAWGTWWTWDPRLTTAFVLWGIYSAYLITRASLDDVHRRARVAAVLAILGILDVPLVVLATRWFRGIHPTSPGMEPSMRWVLLASLIAFTTLFTLLLVRRRAQLRLESLLHSMELDTDLHRFQSAPTRTPAGRHTDYGSLP
ncbi:MAG: cytochrome c biogenesis protein CcsA [Planctomycetota bacterium]|jgi:heme exporter protein C